jgi:hypothetical protein
MRTGPAASTAIVAAWIAFSPPSADAQTTRGEITLGRAREILGASPAAIPGYPFKLFPLFGRAVLVRQELDSGRVIAFREDRDGRPIVTRGEMSNQETANRILAGLPTRAEETWRARQSYRQIGSVSVRYLGSAREPIPYDLLDRLEPIP